MIDLHSHILPGIDDGPRELSGSLALARAALDAGTTTIVATPHVDATYGLGVDDIRRAHEKLCAALADEGIGLEVALGAEIAIERLGSLGEDDLRALTLGGGPWLLVEAPLSVYAGDVTHVLFALQARGHQILLAHPERSPALARNPRAVTALVEAGIRCQITAGSAAGQFGAPVQRTTIDLLRRGLVHDVASDAHDAVRRPPDMLEPLLVLAGQVPGLEERAQWLLHDVPAAILAGDELPQPPPSDEPPRGLFARLRRS